MDLGISLIDFLIEAELQQYYDQIKTDLKILKTSQLKYVMDEDLALLGMSRPEQRRLKKFFAKYFPQNYLSRIKRLLGPGKKDESSTSLGSLSEERTKELQSEMPSEAVSRAPNKHIIPAESITINKELGVGEFGVVQQGVWTNEGYRIQVAIKCLSRERMHSNSMEFLKEAGIMHSIEHKNIVRLYGVVLHPDSLMLVTELAPLRSLLECLKEVSLRSSFPILSLCEFAYQICEGMTYLENKRLIHRDLAARNILVFTRNKVKISDFGLSRALGVGKDYYQTNFNVNLKLPIAWCAPECIGYLRFTSASDVWAYAVTLWEMFSYGFQPWAAFSGHQILVAIDTPNCQRLEQPDSCPREYFALMQKCWNHEPSKRPKFAEILNMLPECKPEQVQAVTPAEFDSNTRRADQLSYRAGDIITVLDKGANQAATQWKGILKNGTTGFFNPQNVITYLGSSLPSAVSQNAFMRSTGNGSGSSLRNSLIRDRDRPSSKRRLRSDMISAPQGEVKHTVHVGLDGTYFGDIPFFDYNQVPKQVVTPYKPSEDLEQTPLINPNSPSHLTGNNQPPNTLLPQVLLREPASSHRQHGPSSSSEASKYGNTHQNSMWPGCKNVAEGFDYDVDPDDQPHEYQEISDDEDQKPLPSPDGGKSLLEEIESTLLGRRSEAAAAAVHQDHEGVNHRNELTELSSKLNHTATLSKKKHTTVKPISANDQRMLDDAIALANAYNKKLIMTDLEHNDPPKTPTTPSEKSKFHFRFALGGHSHGSNTLKSGDSKPSDTLGKMDKRTFSQEAQSVPDIQASLTEESKMAYESLVEQPSTMVKILMKVKEKHGHKSPSPQAPEAASLGVESLKKNHREDISFCPTKSDPSLVYRKAAPATEPAIRTSNGSSTGAIKKDTSFDGANLEKVNPLPLPPRDRTVVSLTSRKRHTRKYPLIIQNPILQRTMDRVNEQPLDHCMMSSLDKGIPAEVSVKNPTTPTENTYENSQSCHYKNMFTKFPFPNQDSYDASSLKFESQLENNFSSIDCCDGVVANDTIEPSREPNETGSNIPRTYSDYQNSNNRDSFFAIEEKNSLNCNNLANLDLEYIDGSASSLNPFDLLSEESSINNPFGDRGSPPQTSELNRHALFNKKKTDLQVLDDPALKVDIENSEENVTINVEDTINLEKHSDSMELLTSKVKAVNDPSPSGVKQYDNIRSMQRRSVGDSIDELEPCMFAKGSPDRVSVEDLLEFADHKPCGRQRGTESDEVRIMCKVLNHTVSPETCLLTLEFASWNVHKAIKLARLRSMGLEGASLLECSAALEGSGSDVARAAAFLAEQRDSSDVTQV